MKSFVAGVLCAAVLGCGSGGGSGDVGARSHRLTVAIVGSGSVSSSPQGIDCGSACGALFASGTAVTLESTPAQGFHFAGWDGACAGTGACTVSMNNDAAVTARFTANLPPPPPPPPGAHALTVAALGEGSVNSAPAGIDCGAACTANYNDGTQVRLEAHPAAGWQFSSWSSGCDPLPLPAGSTDCFVTVRADQTLTVTFTQLPAPPPPPPPPPPADQCAGLMPSALPSPVVASLPQNYCIGGTSDDGDGNFALGYQHDAGVVTYPSWVFFHLQNGQAVRVGSERFGGDESSLSIYSEPNGFTFFEQGGPGNFSQLDEWSRDGQRVWSRPLVSENASEPGRSTIGIDPSGGIAVLAHQWNAQQGWTTSYQRVRTDGTAEFDPVILDHLSATVVAAIGVALSGDALVLLGTGPDYAARWLARDGTALTDWFTINGQGSPTMRFLMDGSMAVGFLRQSPGGPGAWSYSVVAARRAGQSDAPQWMNALSWFAVRNGKAYAAPGGPACAADQIELVAAATGKVCGCTQSVPNLRATNAQSIGRDGSLIVGHAPENFGTCRYDLYPQLFK